MSEGTMEISSYFTYRPIDSLHLKPDEQLLVHVKQQVSKQFEQDKTKTVSRNSPSVFYGDSKITDHGQIVLLTEIMSICNICIDFI